MVRGATARLAHQYAPLVKADSAAATAATIREPPIHALTRSLPRPTRPQPSAAPMVSGFAPCKSTNVACAARQGVVSTACGCGLRTVAPRPQWRQDWRQRLGERRGAGAAHSSTTACQHRARRSWASHAICPSSNSYLPRRGLTRQSHQPAHARCGRTGHGASRHCSRTASRVSSGASRCPWSTARSGST